MCSWKIIRDGLGNPIKVVYSNGSQFEGSFNEKERPFYGTIKDEKGNLVYEGIIEFDIYLYFQKYAETGKTITSKTL